MITLPQITELLGWASVINISYLILATVIVVYMQNGISSIHSKLFRLSTNELNSKYFDFLSTYKIVTLVFILAPYIALKIMGQ